MAEQVTGRTVYLGFTNGDQYEGYECMKIVQTASGESSFGQWVPVIDPTKTYILSGEINASNVATGSHCIDIDWYNGSTYLSSNQIQSTTANAYQLVTSTAITPPANANWCGVFCEAIQAGTYFFDEIQLNINETLTQRYQEAYNAGFNGATATAAATGNVGDDLNAMESVGMKSSYWPSQSYSYQSINYPIDYIPYPPTGNRACSP